MIIVVGYSYQYVDCHGIAEPQSCSGGVEGQALVRVVVMARHEWQGCTPDGLPGEANRVEVSPPIREQLVDLSELVLKVSWSALQKEGRDKIHKMGVIVAILRWNAEGDGCSGGVSGSVAVRPGES